MYVGEKSPVDSSVQIAGVKWKDFYIVEVLTRGS